MTPTIKQKGSMWILFQDLLKTDLSVYGGSRSHGPLQLDDIHDIHAFVLPLNPFIVFNQPDSGPAAFLYVPTWAWGQALKAIFLP